MMRFSERLLTGSIGFALGSVLAFQVVQGQEAYSLDGPLNQVGIVVRDIEASSRVFGDVFGVEVPPPIISRGIPVPPGRGDAVEVKRTEFTRNNVTIELVEPVGGASPWREHLEAHGEGVHHLAFTVDDVGAAVAFLEDRGGDWVLGARGVDFAYVDLTPELGFTIELLGPSLAP